MPDLSILTAPATAEAIQRHAVACFPREACGVVTAAGFVALENRHSDPGRFFDCADEAEPYQQAETLLALVHSHAAGRRERVLPNFPSAYDMQQQVAMDVPWGLCVASATEATVPWWWGPGVPLPPLVGRKFRHGPTGSDGRGDCYSLIRDYFLITHQVELPEIPRSWNWWRGDADLYEDGFRAAGFEPVAKTDVQISDVGLVESPVTAPDGTAIRPKVIHGCVYVGDGLVLHHKHGRLSMIEPLSSWTGMVKYWVRHASQR